MTASRRGGPQKYSIEQAISDNAQLHTIAFSGLAFLTGDFGAATFLPPGKGLRFLRLPVHARYRRSRNRATIPSSSTGLPATCLKALTDEQRAKLEALAREQAPQYRELAEKRWPLIKAFYRELNGRHSGRQQRVERRRLSPSTSPTCSPSTPNSAIGAPRWSAASWPPSRRSRRRISRR